VGRGRHDPNGSRALAFQATIRRVNGRTRRDVSVNAMSELTRTLLGVTLVTATSLVALPAARADNADAAAGTFEVKYEEVTSNCENTGMALTHGSLAIAKRKPNTVSVDISRIPLLVGSANKGGRVKATSKLGKTSIEGLDGRFSLAGTVNDDGVLQMVFVAEYYLHAKAFCTQSWNVSGVRGAAAEKPRKTETEVAPQAALPSGFNVRLPPAE
jgi:hypothetical protein